MKNLPDKKGFFGVYGGCFVPETLMTALHDLDGRHQACKENPAFQKNLQYYLRQYCCRFLLPLYRRQ